MNWINSFLAFCIAFFPTERGDINFLGGGEPSPTDTPPADTPPADPPPGDVTYTFPDGVDDAEVLQAADTTFKNFWKEGKLDTNSVLKSYIHNQRLLGGEKMVIPNNNSTDEEWRDSFHKLGLPPTIDDYKVENTLAEGQQANEKMFTAFREQAYKLGMLPKQAQGVIDFFNSAVSEEIKAQSTVSEQEYNTKLEALKTKWGNAYDKKLGAAKQGFTHYADDSHMEHLQKIGFFEDPIVTEIFANIGETLKEDDFNDEGRSTNDALTPEEIDTEIRNMYKKDTPFMNSKHPDHAKAKERFLALQTMKHGNKPVISGVSKKM